MWGKCTRLVGFHAVYSKVLVRIKLHYIKLCIHLSATKNQWWKAFNNMTFDEKLSSCRVSQLADTCPNLNGASVRLSWGKCSSIRLVQATRMDRLHMKCRTRATIWDNADAERRCSKYMTFHWFATFVGRCVRVSTFLKRSDRRRWSIRCSCCWWLTFDCLRKIIIINTSLHDCAHSTFSMGYVSRGKCRHGHLPQDTCPVTRHIAYRTASSKPIHFIAMLHSTNISNKFALSTSRLQQGLQHTFHS